MFLVYPTIGTIIRSFQNRAGTAFIGLDNFTWFFTNAIRSIALRNSLIWLVVLTLFTVGVGMLVALLVDRVRYETVAKSVIFVPLAISMVAASVIWTFMYDYRVAARTPGRHAQRGPRRVRRSRPSPGSRSRTTRSTRSC